MGNVSLNVPSTPDSTEYTSSYRGDVPDNDCNNATSMGTYNAVPGTLNTPFDSYWHITVDTAANGDWIRQVATQCNNAAATISYHRIYINDAWNAWTNIADNGHSINTNHQVEHVLATATDILEWAASEDCPLAHNTIVRVYNSPTCPTNYGYSSTDSDFIYSIYKIDNHNWMTVKAYDVRSNSEFINSRVNSVWTGWVRCNDGGNSNTVGNRGVAGDLSLLRYNVVENGTDTNTVIATGIYKGAFTNYPSALLDGQGILVVLNYSRANTEPTGAFGTGSMWARQWFISAHGSTVYERTIVNKAVSDWFQNVPFYNNATESTAGLLSTETQHIGGYKTFGGMLSLRTGVVKGTTPSSDVNSRIYFVNDAINYAFGELRCVIRSSDTGESGECDLFLISQSLSGSNRYSMKIMASDSGINYARVDAPTCSASAPVLRNIASGRAAATTSNCPSGAWYGQHS